MSEVAKYTLTVTSFVFVMMLVIEYLNVLLRGAWQEQLARNQWGQYLLAGILGATPGCLGAFAVVALYSHRSLSLGAVVAAMIATSGDEAFVLLAMVPDKAVLLMGLLLVIGIVAGLVTDLISGAYRTQRQAVCTSLELHEEEICHCFPWGEILSQWKACSPARGLLSLILIALAVAIFAGQIGPGAWNWLRVSLLIVIGLSIFIVATVPDHFLYEHLWRHIVLRHIPRVFLWTFAALFVLHIITNYIHLEGVGQIGQWIALVVACMVGLIPESGPHMIFVTLYAKGLIPFSILIASSIVQDGHGMLPMLAHSWRAFLMIKAINLAVGLIVGAVALVIGF